MQTKLTLRLEETLIQKGKRFSRRSGKSVSKIVAEYFESLPVGDNFEITPKVAALKGILKGTGITEEDYHRHLEEKNL